MTLSAKTITAVLALSAAIAALAVSNQSYWIDEALSLIVAQAPTPSDAWKYMMAVSGSTLQMPLYQLYLYVWHKVFWDGEWVMRASNIPWFLLGQLAFLVLLRNKPKLALFACLLAAVSPAVWMYLDETRPYIMQYAAACWLTSAVVRLTTSDEPTSPLTSVALAGSVVVLFGSSLIGVLWAGAFALALLVLMVRKKFVHSGVSPALWTAGILAGVVLGLFATYYAVTWQDAGRGYHRSGSSLLSLPFLAYELLGFTGFGPGKVELRAAPLRSLAQSAPALIPLGAALVALVFFAATRSGKRSRNATSIIAWSIALGLPTIAIFSAMFLHDHRPVPRHFLPALPAVILALAAILTQVFEQKSFLWRAAALLLPLLWLTSALNYRWQPSHAKEDYRTAAKIASAALAQGKEVWWAADPAAAHVYLTPIALEEIPGRAWAMQAPSWDAIRFKFPPRVIVLSKPDIYDPQGAVVRYTDENHFVPARQLHAVTIFTREGEALPEISP